MSWRPDGWLQNRKLNSGLAVSHPHLSGELWSAYEQGAAAMLEALRREGLKQRRMSISKNKLVEGYEVFIPDEEAQQ